MIPNRIRIEDIPHMKTEVLLGLSTEEYLLLLEDLAQEKAELAGIESRLTACLDIRYGAQAAEARRVLGKHAGTVRFKEGEFTIIAELPKKVSWDQGMLARIVAEIQAAGEDPGEYVALQYKVAERAYGAWPSSIRAAFEPARTVGVGRPTYRIERK